MVAVMATPHTVNPEVLAVNCRNTETHWDYNGNDIYFRFDNDERMRKTLLTAQMKNNNILEKVNKSGWNPLKQSQPFLE